MRTEKIRTQNCGCGLIREITREGKTFIEFHDRSDGAGCGTSIDYGKFRVKKNVLAKLEGEIGGDPFYIIPLHHDAY